MLQEKRLMFVVKCPVPHDGVPLSRGAYDYNRNMTDRERVQSVQSGADMAVPLFSVFLGGAVFLQVHLDSSKSGGFSRPDKAQLVRFPGKLRLHG